MNYFKLIIFTLISLIIIESLSYIVSVEAINLGNSTLISLALSYISILILIFIAYKESFGYFEIPNSIKDLYLIWLFWNVFNLLRGALLAADYWEWKDLIYSGVSFSLIPLVFFLGKNIKIALITFRFVIKYLFLYGFVFIPLTLVTNEELYSRLMIPVSLMILFIPFLKFKWKVLVVIVAIVSIVMVIGFRSNVIKIIFSILLLTSWYFRNYINRYWLSLAHFSLFAIPIILFSLAISGHYNIFEETAKEEGYKTINQAGEEENLMDDTRTFLYVEVLSSLDQTNDWIIGKSAMGSYQSDWFTDDGGAMNGKRAGCEVGMLNILLRNGMIGVLIYFLILFTVSRYAIIHSSNYLSKMIGLYIAFRWTYSFVEEFTLYDLNFYFFWIAIGLASSARFRNMDDQEITSYFELI